MRRNVKGITALALALCLLLAACGGQEASPSEATPEEAPLVLYGFPELEETEWQTVSINAKDYGIVEDPIGDPAVYGGASSLSLDRLIAFLLSSDSAASKICLTNCGNGFWRPPIPCWPI